MIRISVSISLLSSFAYIPGCGDSSPPADVPSGTEVASPAASAPARPDAYAAMVVAPKNLPDDPGAQIIVMFLNNSDVPSASDVHVPVYPDARVMSTMAATAMTVNGEKITGLPSMAMLSADDIAEVVAFYQAQPAGWQHKEFFGTHSFWNGGEDSNPLDITGQFSQVVVVPLAEDTTERAMWPEVRTRIDIRYEPEAP